MNQEILGNVLDNRILSIRSATDRFPGRKFSTSLDGIKNQFKNMHEVSTDSIYLIEKVLKCYNVYEHYGSEKFDRYTGSLKKDVYSLPMMLGLNESIKECHNRYLAVYDMSKLHTVVLSVLLGECPKRTKIKLEEYLQLKGISFTKYLNYIVNGVNSDIFEKGFSVFEMLNYISNSYLNIKRMADDKKVSVTEFVRLYLIKYHEVVFNKFMAEMEENKREVLVQSVGLDTLIISSPNAKNFSDLTFVTGKNRYSIQPEIMLTDNFNKEIPQYYLDRKLVNAC